MSLIQSDSIFFSTNSSKTNFFPDKQQDSDSDPRDPEASGWQSSDFARWLIIHGTETAQRERRPGGQEMPH